MLNRFYSIYWPAPVAEDYATAAFKRSLATFCVLAGLVGLAITISNLKYLHVDPVHTIGGGLLSLFCLISPWVVNQAQNFARAGLSAAWVAFVSLFFLAFFQGTLISAPTLIMIPMVMTFALVFGIAAGIAFGAGAIALFLKLYFFDLAAAPPMTVLDGRVIDWGTTCVALCASIVFTVFGASVFRAQTILASQRLQAVNRVLSAERASLELRVAERTADLAQATRRAEDANAAKSRFLANMSHELRTPLNAIIGFSEIMSETAESERRIADLDDHARVLRAARHLLHIVNEVLDLSKIEADKMVLSQTQCDFAEIATQSIEAVAPLAATRGIALKHELAHDLGLGMSDRIKVSQCLLNLLSNAVKFTRVGEVRLRAWREGEQICFEVADTGPGISAEVQSVLFEPFVQGDSSDSREHAGTGLGLAITRRLARMLGGEITLASTVGVGSIFTLRLAADCMDVEQSALAA